MAVSVEEAREIVYSFRYNCLIKGEQCAVTSRGRSLCNIPIGPSVQACHIIPQQHYYLYRDPEGLGESLDDLGVLYRPARLQATWQRTWSSDNGILLFSHLHELFDMRLFSIHPDTLRIRIFVPYDILLDYHGKTAQVPANVDRGALRHHYEMCCIKNMGSKIPPIEQTSSGTSGAASPFGERVNVPSLLSARPPGTASNSAEPSDSQASPGDPSKRSRPVQDGNEYPSSSVAKTPSSVEHVSPGLVPHPTKRRRVSCGVGREERRWGDGAMFNGCITGENSVEFLADVIWELKRAVLVRLKDEPHS